MPPGASTVCVFDIRGVRALLRDTPDGMDVTLLVVGDVNELRRRARAALSGQYPVRPETKAIEQSVRASIRDEPDGLTINVTPIDAHELDRIRGAIRHRMDEATSDNCHD